MDYMTRWGYSVELEDGADTLPPIITAAQFNAITGGVMSSTTERIEAVLDGVSQAIRDYCGWHVAPILSCNYIGNGTGRTMVLPATDVRSVEAVALEGEDLDATAYEWIQTGLLWLKFRRFPDAWRSVDVTFTAGNDSVGALAMAAAQIAANALAGTAGVREEHAGAVGITYNQTASGVSGGVRLLESDLALLTPYRITTF